jgi:hypothetical protein
MNIFLKIQIQNKHLFNTHLNLNKNNSLKKFNQIDHLLSTNFKIQFFQYAYQWKDLEMNDRNSKLNFYE